MSSHDRTLVVLGQSGVGKSTIEGSILFKYGGIDMITMQMLETSGHGYDLVSKKMRSLDITPRFDTPGKYHVTILDGNIPNPDSKAACTIFVIAPETLPPADQDQIMHDALSNTNELIMLVNKMDAFGWSEEQFKKTVKTSTTYLESNGIDMTKIPIIPVSAIHGDNLVDLSPKCSWYTGWVKKCPGNSENGKTLLEALDAAFKA